MSQDVRTRPAESGDRESLDGLDGLDGGASVSATDVLDRIWRFFISMRTGLGLILGLGLLSLIGTLLVQAPAGMTADPAAYASWLASIHSKYGGWTPVFDKLGFFAVFTSIWFKAITVLLTTSVLACSVNRAPRLWKLAFHPRTRMGETFFTHAPLRATSWCRPDPTRRWTTCARSLRSHRFRTITDPDDEGLNLYADRFRWGPFGTVVAHLSFVVILVGFFLSATTGFKDTQFIVPVGSTVQVGHGTGLSVKAMSFNDAYYPDGSPVTTRATSSCTRTALRSTPRRSGSTTPCVLTASRSTSRSSARPRRCRSRTPPARPSTATPCRCSGSPTTASTASASST